MFFLTLFTKHQRLKQSNYLRSFYSDGFPDFFEVNIIILMNKHITHAGNILPRNLRVRISKTSGKTLYRLTGKKQLMQHGGLRF